jgi:hypothetical protein
MIDLDSLLQPVLDDSPGPPSFAAVRRRATTLHRRRRRRMLGGALVVVVIVGAAVVSIAGRGDTHPHVTVRPARPPTVVHVGTPATFGYPAMDMLFADGAIWISQPDRVARVDQTTGRVVATIPVAGTSDFRNLAFGAGSIWVDDTGQQTVTRIDPRTNRVIASIRLADAPLVVDGLAFVDGRLWIVRPAPMDESRGDVVAIDPATNKVVRRATIPRTFTTMSSGTDALWYVRDTDLVRFDVHTLHTTVVRRGVTDVLAVSGSRVWIHAGSAVLETDARTGATIGSPIPVRDTANVTATVGADAVWIAGQPDSSSPGTVTPYDLTTHRAAGRSANVGLPILRMTDIGKALWVDAGGLFRIPFDR